MKALHLFSIGLLALLFFGCQKPVEQQELNTITKGLSGMASKKPDVGSSTYSCTDYQLSLTVDKTSAPGKTIFIWTITNPHPGNGETGLQNLSHWEFVPGQCLVDNWQDVEEAWYNTGTGWTLISPLPAIEPDPAMAQAGCNSGNVFKFNQGTNGSTPTQYKLVLNGNWGTGDLDVYLKSGGNSGCCNEVLPNSGIGCKEDICSYSQGYWFASNAAHPYGIHSWPNDIIIGGQTYTQAEGLAIWNTSNQGGITDAKKAFTQLAAIKLSGVDETVPAISGSITIIETWLASLPYKLSPDYLPNQTAAEKQAGDAKAAANTISQWITEHHCD